VATSRRVELGLVGRFLAPVTPVRVAGLSLYLVNDDGQYKLFSRICPHKGGNVQFTGDHFECPQHGWRFDRQTGHSQNAVNARLVSYDVTRVEERLHAELPVEEMLPARIRAKVPDLTLKVHAHACLEIQHRGFSLLMDPWLEGTAFLGSWVHYPQPVITPSELSPDAILISHEHSDHFHEPTLAHFSRSTPVLAPDFPNRRILRRLERMGFSDVRPLRFGETYSIAPGIEVAAYEPSGVWNDAILVVDVAGFRILNLNDAGINQRIARLLKPVDLVAAQFSIGASGFPWKWTNMVMATKIALMQRSHEGRLAMLRQAVELYDAQYLLPFASHFGLWHPSHAPFMQALPRVTFEEVRQIVGDRAEVLSLLPGASWRASSRRITHHYQEKDVFDQQRMMSELGQRFEAQAAFQDCAGVEALDRGLLSAYFLQFNDAPEIAFCEDLTVLIQSEDGGDSRGVLELALRIELKKLEILESYNGRPNLTIRMPQRVLSQVVNGDLSWDEAHVGYWGTYSREPDIYTPGFWRMLQAPYFKRCLATPTSSMGRQSVVSTRATVAALIEQHGEHAERVLRRYGLYCGGCHRANYETLHAAASQHGLNSDELDRLVVELQRVCGPENTHE
jgi:CMP-N-acetylneuraminate monooxygenase